MNGIFLGLIILYLVFNLGCRILALLGVSAEEDETVVFGTALGLGLLGYAVLILGLCGILSRTSLWWLIGFLAVPGVWDFRSAVSVLGKGFLKWKMHSPRKSLVFISLSAIAVFSALLGTLAPEIANDSLCYHLHLPKVFLASHSIGRIPYEVNSLFPFLMEMLYTLGLGVSGVTLAKFFHFATGLLGAGGILLFLRRFVKIEIAWIAALLFITMPGILNQLDTTYVDAGLTCFTVLALIAFLRWADTRNLRWMILSGAFLGLALSVKYFAVLSVLIVLILAVFECRKNGDSVKQT
ncbi:MAG TPA: glycosyltransferase family 39 protein, partial [Candidatus Omnitrophota bacterium]|nr:glycosyltransferase family 39 protein [Candidatus Omnitrophota bacterium]